MGKYVFKKNSAGIKKLLQSQGTLSVMESVARSRANGGEITSFVGFDRAKAIIKDGDKT